MANQALQELIPKIHSATYVTQFEEEKPFAKVANTSLSSEIKKMGQEIEIEIGPKITHNRNWTGGDVAAAEKVAAATTKIKVNKGGSIHYIIPMADEVMVSANPKRQKEYVNSAIESYKVDIESDAADLYQRAGTGIYIRETNENAISIDSSNALNLIAEMERRVKTANISSGSKFFLIADPSFYANIRIDGRNFYTESGLKIVNGYMTEKFGFKLYESNRCKTVGDDSYIYFGVEKECIGLCIKKDVSLMGYTPENKVDNAFKGVTMHGIGVYDTRKFGVAKVRYSSVLPNLAD